MSVLPIGISGEAAGYQIERSLRFNSADSAYLNRTFGTPTNNKIFTISAWVKTTNPSAGLLDFSLLAVGDAGIIGISGAGAFGATYNNRIFIRNGGATGDYWLPVFRDVSAWYHFVIAIDTTQATQADRAKLWINGVSQASNKGASTLGLNATMSVNAASTTHYIGGTSSAGYYANGYLTEYNFIDGQALTPSSFGETDTDTGVWKPKAYSGSYGTNGFYLNFSDNSGTTSTTLGKDYSGNSNNWTPNNFSVTAGAGNDSLVDTPTNYGTDTGVGGEVRGNYCTMNPLDSKNGTASNGNLLWTATASQSDIRGTFAIPASGKWYMECTVGSTTNASSAVSFGLATSSVALDASNAVTGLYQLYASSSGFLSLNGTNVSSSLGAWTAGDVLQIAVDVDNTKMWLGKNNTWYNSSGGTTGNPSTGANATSTTSMVGLFPFSNCYQNNATWNAGQRAFAYTAPSGFKALCTTNLPEPTIAEGRDYFNAVLYTGNGSTQSITGVGFQPDLVWAKCRSNSYHHKLVDAVRGTTLTLSSSQTSAEQTEANSLTAFNSDGFSLGNISSMNASAETFVAWNWKANGAGSSNTAGTISSTVSANTTAGFSIVTYTGTAASATVGHGLGVTPSMIIVKNRSASPTAWRVYHSNLGLNGSYPNFLQLNTTAAVESGDTGNFTAAPSSTVFSVGNYNVVNGSGNSMVAYCFAPIAGYSAFGSFVGSGSTDGPFVWTGFAPRFILVKNASYAGTSWEMFDTARQDYNQNNLELLANSSAAEGAYTFGDILSNGFKLRSSNNGVNRSGDTLIYAAFASNPFKIALGR